MKYGRFTAGSIAILAACLTLMACGDTTQTTPTGAEDGATPAGGGSGTMTVSIPGDIDNFDPYTNQLIQYEWAIRSTVFDTLVEYDENLEIVPGVATPEANADATEFTFVLEDGVTFTDGAPLDAEAVVASLKEAAKSKGIYAARLADIKRYDTPDATTVKIALNKPDASFLDGLAKIAIVAPKHFRTAKSDPVGSGPFVFESWTPNDQIVLRRNDDYWGEQPAYAELVLKPVPDEQVALNQIYSGQLDVLGSAQTNTVKQADTNRVNVVEPEASNSIALVEMMGKSGKLADPKLRQAMAHAFDRESIKKIAYGGRGDSLWSPLPAGSWAYAEQEGYPYDIARAKQLVQEAGKEGTSVTLDLLAGNPEAEQMARVWQQSLAEAGIDLKIRTSELSVWLDRYVNHDYDAIWNFFNVSGDPDSFFDVIMKPHLDDQYDNPEMERLVLEAKGTTDQDARAEIYGQLQEMLVADVPVLTVQSRPLAAITAKDVVNLKVNPLGWPLLDGAGLGN